MLLTFYPNFLKFGAYSAKISNLLCQPKATKMTVLFARRNIGRLGDLGQFSRFLVRLPIFGAYGQPPPIYCGMTNFAVQYIGLYRLFGLYNVEESSYRCLKFKFQRL